MPRLSASRKDGRVLRALKGTSNCSDQAKQKARGAGSYKTVSIPNLSQKIASAAASDSSSAAGSTLAKIGISKDIPKLRIGTNSRNTVWIANQIEGLRITPTTAAVIADSAPARAFVAFHEHMNGAPRKIQRKHGVNVTHVASNPPSVPASIGDNDPGSRNAAMKPTN